MLIVWRKPKKTLTISVKMTEQFLWLYCEFIFTTKRTDVLTLTLKFSTEKWTARAFRSFIIIVPGGNYSHRRVSTIPYNGINGHSPHTFDRVYRWYLQYISKLNESRYLFSAHKQYRKLENKAESRGREWRVVRGNGSPHW